MFSRFDIQIRQILTGNLLLIICLVFYLAWWLIAFKPEGAVKGMKSGWLLIPAFLFGLAAVIFMVRGSITTGMTDVLIKETYIFIGAVIAYVVLLAGTFIIMKRQVTTELLLIVGWAALTAAELNAVYAHAVFSKGRAVAWITLTLISAVISMICYLAYYRLDAVKGYIDGTVPLALALVIELIFSADILMR